MPEQKEKQLVYFSKEIHHENLKNLDEVMTVLEELLVELEEEKEEQKNLNPNAVGGRKSKKRIVGMLRVLRKVLIRLATSIVQPVI